MSSESSASNKYWLNDKICDSFNSSFSLLSSCLLFSVPGVSFNDFTVESFILFAKSGPTNHYTYCFITSIAVFFSTGSPSFNGTTLIICSPALFNLPSAFSFIALLSSLTFLDAASQCAKAFWCNAVIIVGTLNAQIGSNYLLASFFYSSFCLLSSAIDISIYSINIINNIHITYHGNYAIKMLSI
jgi:hypothetical protein